MTLYSFFFIIALAAVQENPVFLKALGINNWIVRQDSVKKILLYGASFSWVLLATTIANHFVAVYVANNQLSSYLLVIFFLLVVFAVYLATYYLVTKLFPKLSYDLIRILPIVTFNTALFGVFYTVLNRNYDLSQSLAYAIGNGIGYTAASFIIYYGRKRLNLSPIPESFKGTPILLLYIGLLSLALYGLIGYGVSS